MSEKNQLQSRRRGAKVVPECADVAEIEDGHVAAVFCEHVGQAVRPEVDLLESIL
jgi:hypothetical protein